ncbi:pantothenate kinase [Gracilibacillus boraciitolerans JCM 21714]|uniref:Type III pantothenate kinase n=1 Tax=Gracilibacillus boraciitolerans JCM 21714 TaxID=1298598 RepID=W4VLY6_9BACI|nr:type III pantothenate kinase [Gracilibacillus boraciitolerans]GAE94217.1 pantothenate kinase [Gracilibacillus boraciitolerans JCM 21714]
MIFVLDVGNTNTVLGVFRDGQLTYQWRMQTDKNKTEDEYAMFIKSLLEHEGLTFSDINGIIISSVVPPILFALQRMADKYFYSSPMIIGDDKVNPYLKMKYPNPKELGADRVVNAVGVIKEYGSPSIIIDFGTATTYCYINNQDEYVSGVITPGINISLEALYQNAAKLPKIELKKPAAVLGNSTIEAMQSGVYFGYVGQVDAVVNRIKQETGGQPQVIATGGLATLIAKDSSVIDIVDPYLTLKGLYEIYKQNEQDFF